MTLSKIHRFGVAAMACTALSGAISCLSNDFALASAAHAQSAIQPVLPSQLKLDQCAQREAVLAGLDQENQSILVAGEFPGTDGNTGERINLKFAFTGNIHNLSGRGYQIYSNMKGQLCKGKDFDNVRVLDGRRGEIDTRAYMKPINLAPEGSLNLGLQNIKKNGNQVPFYQARDIHTSQLMTVTGQYNADGRGGEGGYTRSDTAGNALIFKLLENVRYTDVGLSILGGR